MMTTFRLSLDWGDFVYFFWAYLWKSIEFLRVDRLFNEQGAFQVPPRTPLRHIITSSPAICLHALFHSYYPAFDDFFLFTFSTTPLPHGVIIHHSLTARPVNRSISLACPLELLVRCEGGGGVGVPGMSLHEFDHFFFPSCFTGKYHVEQDPQFALVHLQFVHWADKLLKVIFFFLCIIWLPFHC